MVRSRGASVVMTMALVVVCLGAPAGATAARAQQEYRDLDAVDMALELSGMERSGQYDRMYDLMHPAAMTVIPREVVIGWYTDAFAPQGPQPITVTNVEYVTWTWPVTGETFPNTAELAITQPFANGSPSADVIHLVQEDGVWRWFFGSTLAFVEEQMAIYMEPLERANAYGGAECQGAASWWKTSLGNLYGLSYVTYTGITIVEGGGDLGVYRDSPGALLVSQRYAIPPRAAETIHDDLLRMMRRFGSVVNDPGPSQLGDLEDLRDDLEALDMDIDAFLDTCEPPVVFLGTGGESFVIVIAGEPLDGDLTIACEVFEDQGVDAQAFFEVAGNDDIYGLDDDGDGVACEPGEGPDPFIV